jgi:hypothetical protein
LVAQGGGGCQRCCRACWCPPSQAGEGNSSDTDDETEDDRAPDTLARSGWSVSTILILYV